jgi:hypothetical protein
VLEQSDSCERAGATTHIAKALAGVSIDPRSRAPRPRRRKSVRAAGRVRGDHGPRASESCLHPARARSPALTAISPNCHRKGNPPTPCSTNYASRSKTHLDELLGEAHKLRRALGALGSRDRAVTPSPSATPTAAPERARQAPTSRTAIRGARGVASLRASSISDVGGFDSLGRCEQVVVFALDVGAVRGFRD